MASRAVPILVAATADEPVATRPAREAVWAGGLAAALLALYLPLLNPYWTPSGDGEIFLASARSILRGEGFRFNGYPVAIVPPGWPAVLALAMKLGAGFAALKLLTALCSVAALVLWYLILRRWAAPSLAAAACVLTSLLGEMYPLHSWLLSDPLFMLISAAGLLLALRVGEGRGGRGTVAMLALLVAAAVTVRWAGLFNVAIFVGALLRGQRRVERNLPWVASGIVLASALLAFGGWRFHLDRQVRLSRPPSTQPGATQPADMTLLPAPTDLQAQSAENERAPREPNNVFSATTSYDIVSTKTGPAEYARRILGAGEWLATLVCRPLRLARSSGLIRLAAILLGTVLAVPLLAAAFDAVRRRHEWVWAGAALYCFTLVVVWTVNPRYFLPLAPMLIVGVLLGCRQLAGDGDGPRWRTATMRLAAVVFVAAVAASNGLLWAIDVGVARAGPAYYDRFEAGVHKELIAAAAYLRRNTTPDVIVAVSGRYENLGKARFSPLPSRATVMLADRRVVSVPTHLASMPNRERLRRYLRSSGASYYLYQPPMSPWRLWHFRAPWLQRHLTGHQDVPDLDSRWRLFRVTRGEVREVDLSNYREEPVAVPGTAEPAR